MTTKEQVAAMAYSTGERLRSSAVELFKGLESSLQNREQFEVALAKVFGSCTGDFNKRHHQSEVPLPSQGSSVSYSEEEPPRRHTLGVAPLRREPSTASSRRNKSGSKASLGRKKRRSGGGGGSVSSQSSSASSRGREMPRERRQSRADYGEHIYAQLFMDDQKRASQAVNTLRETAVARAPPAATSSSAAIAAAHHHHHPFPVSSPPRNEPRIAPLASNDLHVPITPSFDDGISAISQHTLEAMEERVNRVRSTDSSLWSSLKESKTPPLQSKTPPLPPQPRTSPVDVTMPRVRSEQSKASKQSRTSRTTHTSDTSSFQNMWQREEQRFWNSQVEQDSRKSRKSKNGSSYKTADNTLPTTESSFEDVWGSPLRHPHDASPLARDPDRIGAIFVVPHTEMAEI